MKTHLALLILAFGLLVAWNNMVAKGPNVQLADKHSPTGDELYFRGLEEGARIGHQIRGSDNFFFDFCEAYRYHKDPMVSWDIEPATVNGKAAGIKKIEIPLAQQ